MENAAGGIQKTSAMDFRHMVNRPVQLLRRADFIIHPVGGHLNAHRKLHKIFARAVALHEQLVKILIQKNHPADSICRVTQNKSR